MDNILIPTTKEKQYLFWTDEEINLLKLHTGKMSFREMSKLFQNRTPLALQRKSIKLGLISLYRHKDYTHNHNAFSTPNLANCWAAGFLAADGSVNKKKNTVRLEINQKDDFVLKEINKIIESDSKIFYYSKPKYQKLNELIHCCKLHFTSKQMVNDLENNFNVVENKTKRLGPPKNLTKEQELSYITGYLDGDGSINFTKKDNRCRLYVCSSSLEIMEWIRDIINKRFGYLLKIKDYRGGTLYEMAAHDNKALKIINELKKINCPRLPRKWENPLLLEQLANFNLINQ